MFLNSNKFWFEVRRSIRLFRLAFALLPLNYLNDLQLFALTELSLGLFCCGFCWKLRYSNYYLFNTIDTLILVKIHNPMYILRKENTKSLTTKYITHDIVSVYPTWLTILMVRNEMENKIVEQIEKRFSHLKISFGILLLLLLLVINSFRYGTRPKSMLIEGNGFESMYWLCHRNN